MTVVAPAGAARRPSGLREPMLDGRRLAAMPKLDRHPSRCALVSRAALALAIALAVAGCSGAAAASQPPAASPSPEPSPSLDLPSPSTDPGVGGGASGDPGTGIGSPVDPTPVDPGASQPALQVPKPGRLNPHPVSPQSLQASVDGRHVLVKVTWYGGVPPCAVLDSVTVDRSGSTIALTVLEGADQADAICIEIAMLKATIVDLGELEPGTWTIRATDSDVAPIEVTIT